MGALLFIGVLWAWLGRGPEDEGAEGEDAAGAEGAVADDRAHWPAVLRGHPLDDDRASLAGRVSDPQGRPIVGATVCAWPEREAVSSVELREPTCGQTGKDGAYRLDGLIPVGTHVSAFAPEYVPANYVREGARRDRQSTVRLHPRALVEGVDLVLEPGGVLVEGFVRDIGGGPIEGALVQIGGSWSRPRVGTSVGLSAEDGAFALWTAPGEMRVRARADGYAGASASGTAPGQTIELLLTPESVLVGQVVLAGTREPVGKIKVSARGSSAFADEDGRFRIDGLRPGTYKPEAKGPELYGKAARAVHLGLGQTSESVLVEVHPAFFIEGKIVLAGSREPCPEGGWVNVTEQTSRERHRGTADDAGQVVLEGLQPGTYNVAVGCPGLVPEDKYPPIEIADASITDIAWEVREGLAIHGEVVDEQGAGVAEITVYATMKGGEPRGQSTGNWGESTEGDGSFTLPGLIAGTYTVDVRGDRPGPAEPLEVELPAGQDLTGVRIELPAVGAIEGVVRDARGEPVAGAFVRTRSRLWGRARTNTSDAGTFRLDNVRPGEHRVTASQGWSDQMRAPGTSDDDVQGEKAMVAAGETAHVELVVEAPEGRITGRVVDQSGTPVTDAFVDAQRESDSAAAREGSAARRVRWQGFGGWGSTPELTDAEGRFALEDLEAGTYTVRAYRKGGGEAFSEAVALGSDVELVLEDTGQLSGRVVVAGGGAPDRFSLGVRDRTSGFSYSEEFFRTEGSFWISNLPAGTFEITARAAQGTAKTEIELAEGASKDGIEIALQPKVTVRGVLVDAQTGAPVPGHRVRVAPAGGGISFGASDLGPERTEISDASGAFEVPDVPTGKVQVVIMAANFGDSDYGWTTLHRTLPPSPDVQDLGKIEMIQDRLADRERDGDLGIKLKEKPPEVEWDEAPLEVAFIRPDGPAAKTALRVGDVIVAVDGQDVTGDDRYRYSKLTRAPEGTAVTLEVERGEKVRIVLGKPL